MKHDWTKGEALGKSTAILLCGFVAFILFGLALGTGLPLLGIRVEVAVAISVVLSVPMWCALALWALLAPSGRGAWLRLGAAATLFAAVALGGWLS